ncbi:hypothetical protein RUND412_008048 [Rhizina undulata]
MQCSICERDTTRLNCASCAQEAAFHIRFQNLLVITERDAASEKVQGYLDGKGCQHNDINTQRGHSRERIKAMREETARLKSGIEADKARLAALRKEHAERHRRLEEGAKMQEQREQMIESIQRDTRRLNTKWKALYSKTAEARSFLCREAAALYNLRQKKRKTGKIEYMIGGVTIPNFLQDLNSHSHHQITTSLALLSHLLVLVSHYLGLKLPNEIILSTRDSPTTSIRGTFNNRHVVTRSLHLDSPLSALSREHTTSHAKFIEAISMLAINIAWLCFSQGLEINEIEDACHPGWNLWRLLVSREGSAVTSPGFGRASHATVNGNLAAAPGQALMGRFKLGYKVLVEKIRYTLQGETIVADWDMVPEAEGGGPKSMIVGSIVSVGGGSFAGDASEADSTAFGSPRRVSTNGWTRIRTRVASADSDSGRARD